MKRGLIFAFIMLLIGSVSAQMPIYTDQHVASNKKLSDKNFKVFEVGNITLFNGDGKEAEHFYIIDKTSGNKIFDYVEPEAKARHLYPKFFMDSKNPDLIILCMSLEGTYSWGTHIFIIDHDNVSNSGFIPYGADNFNFSGLGIYAQFEQHDDWFVMFFQDDINLINYETDDLISSSDLEFKIEKDKITRLK